MAKHRTPVQFRLEEELFNILKNEADARALTPNEFAKKLLHQILLTDLKATERNATNIKLTATSTFALLSLVPLIIELIRPDLTQEEVMDMAETKVFSGSRQRADSLMRSLGVEE